MSRREFFALGSLAALCLLLGLFPQPLLDTMKPDVRVLTNIGDAARDRVPGVPYVTSTTEPPPVPAPTDARQGRRDKGGDDRRAGARRAAGAEGRREDDGRGVRRKATAVNACRSDSPSRGS